jgi:hypothetical protein
MRVMEQALQLLGAVLILTAFIGAQTKRMAPGSRIYLVLNFVGSVILAVLAGVDADLGFLLLETVWALVSAWGLLRRVPT